MKLPILLAALLSTSALAGENAKVEVRTTSEPLPRVYSIFETAYGFEADYERGGSGSMWEAYVSAGVIIPWTGAPLPGRDFGTWQWRLGAAYHRFEFDHDSRLPLPDRLQSIAAVIALELQLTDSIGALLDIRPGIYFEDDISDQAFDCPVRLGFGYRLSDRFALVGMARYRGFAENPLLGGAGFIWNITDRLTLSAIYPEPRLTFRSSDHLDLWLGAEWSGGVYRVDREPGRGRRSGTVVDYTDTRAALGATWRSGSWRIEAAGGVSIEREWDFHRAGDRYETDEMSPFVKLSARLEW